MIIMRILWNAITKHAGAYIKSPSYGGTVLLSLRQLRASAAVGLGIWGFGVWGFGLREVGCRNVEFGRLAYLGL